MAAEPQPSRVPLPQLSMSWADVVDDDDVCPSPPLDMTPSPRTASGGTSAWRSSTPGSAGRCDGDRSTGSPSAATMFHNLPARVRQRLKTTPRTTRAGTGKARLVASLDEQSSAKAYRRRKGAPRGGRQQSAASGTRGETPRATRGRALDLSSPATPPAPPAAQPSGSGDKVGAGVRSRVVAGRRRAPATPPRASPATEVPAPLAAAGFAPFTPPTATVTPQTRRKQQSGRSRRNGGAGNRRNGRQGSGRSPRTPARAYTHTAWERAGSCSTKCDSMYEALGREVQDYVTYRDRHAAALRPRVEADIARLQAIVTSTFDWCSLEVYGSFASGLWLPGSDVDLVALANDDGTWALRAARC